MSKNKEFNATVGWFRKSAKGNMVSARITVKDKEAVDNSFEVGGKLILKELKEESLEKIRQKYEQNGWNPANIPTHTLEVMSAESVASFESDNKAGKTDKSQNSF